MDHSRGFVQRIDDQSSFEIISDFFAQRGKVWAGPLAFVHFGAEKDKPDQFTVFLHCHENNEVVEFPIEHTPETRHAIGLLFSEDNDPTALYAVYSQLVYVVGKVIGLV